MPISISQLQVAVKCVLAGSVDSVPVVCRVCERVREDDAHEKVKGVVGWFEGL